MLLQSALQNLCFQVFVHALPEQNNHRLRLHISNKRRDRAGALVTLRISGTCTASTRRCTPSGRPKKTGQRSKPSSRVTWPPPIPPRILAKDKETEQQQHFRNLKPTAFFLFFKFYFLRRVLYDSYPIASTVACARRPQSPAETAAAAAWRMHTC